MMVEATSISDIECPEIMEIIITNTYTAGNDDDDGDDGGCKMSFEDNDLTVEYTCDDINTGFGLLDLWAVGEWIINVDNGNYTVTSTLETVSFNAFTVCDVKLTFKRQSTDNTVLINDVSSWEHFVYCSISDHSITVSNFTYYPTHGIEQDLIWIDSGEEVLIENLIIYCDLGVGLSGNVLMVVKSTNIFVANNMVIYDIDGGTSIPAHFMSKTLITDHIILKPIH